MSKDLEEMIIQEKFFKDKRHNDEEQRCHFDVDQTPALSSIGKASFRLRLLLLCAQDQPGVNICTEGGQL